MCSAVDMRSRYRSLAVLTLLVPVGLGGCTGLSEEQNRRFLQPGGAELFEPSHLGLAHQEMRVDLGGGTTLHGWLVPSPRAGGRTVVLFHDGRTNIGQLHPYYRFLHQGGFHVFLFDYRGFGESSGEPNLRAAFYDMPWVIEWLHDRPEVDRNKIAYYGLSLGATIALHTAARYAQPAAVVVENPVSPINRLQSGFREEGDDAVTSALRTYALQFSSLPDGSEPDENASSVYAPVLVMMGEGDGRLDRFSTLRTYLSARGPKDLWILADTGDPPHALMTYDGEYQRTVVAFLQAALEGRPPRIDVDWEVTGKGAQGTWVDATVRRGSESNVEPWAVQLGAVDESGAVTLHNVWLDGPEETFRFAASDEPALLVARRFRHVLGDEEGTGWLREPSSLTRAGRLWQQVRGDVDVLVNGAPDVAEVLEIAARIEGLGALPEALEARMAQAFFLIGKRLWAVERHRDMARQWLQRCVHAAPEDREAWFWPGLEPIWGFPFGDEVAEARRMLAQ